MSNQTFRSNHRQPMTVNLPMAAALLPGSAVARSAGALVALASAVGAEVLVLGAVDFKDQTVTDAYTVGDTGIGYIPEGGDIFEVIFAAATYTAQQALTVDADGRFAAATSGDLVVALFDGTPGALLDDARADVIWATSSYIAA